MVVLTVNNHIPPYYKIGQRLYVYKFNRDHHYWKTRTYSDIDLDLEMYLRDRLTFNVGGLTFIPLIHESKKRSARKPTVNLP